MHTCAQWPRSQRAADRTPSVTHNRHLVGGRKPQRALGTCCGVSRQFPHVSGFLTPKRTEGRQGFGAPCGSLVLRQF
jgi:hypothetical protein